MVASRPEEHRRYRTLLEKLGPAWLKLIHSGAIQPILLEDSGGRAPQIVGCEASVFDSDQFLEHLKAEPMVWLAPELVRRALLDDGKT